MPYNTIVGHISRDEQFNFGGSRSRKKNMKTLLDVLRQRNRSL